MAQTKDRASPPSRRKRGFEPAAKLVAARVQSVSEGRGFAVTRLLTHWPEIVGEQLAAMTRPVKISHSRGGFGATLTLLTTGPAAPMIEMQLPQLREKVNVCYGYNAIQRILLTQTAPEGFAEGQARFAQKTVAKPAPDPADLQQAGRVGSRFDDPTLAEAMRQLTLNHTDKQTRKR
ncbi:DUF721 domain-containing protein [Paracoccus tegillarcae]|uniref:DUF721 domain-containing protein n=1 Tax=Paracoccus tegillarcae TaxID=1529068 RepID=A0A2K9EPD3_9RHOB|nr:DUF721 domain-containing protein [Paracoccus tegillarcae]AUH35347.1 DUF721 domain-containing protein [Paracoccus tegillarcae]